MAFAGVTPRAPPLGVVAHTCNLVYQGESGALNEHFADAFGVMVKQWRRTRPPLRPNG